MHEHLQARIGRAQARLLAGLAGEASVLVLMRGRECGRLRELGRRLGMRNEGAQAKWTNAMSDTNPAPRVMARLLEGDSEIDRSSVHQSARQETPGQHADDQVGTAVRRSGSSGKWDHLGRPTTVPLDGAVADVGSPAGRASASRHPAGESFWSALMRHLRHVRHQPSQGIRAQDFASMTHPGGVWAPCVMSSSVFARLAFIPYNPNAV